MAQPTTRRVDLHAMGTTISVYGPSAGSERAAGIVAATFATEERRFSRFRPDSELSRVNAAAGRRTRVSAPFAWLLRCALDHAAETQGLFDPTVLRAIEAAGYDDDLDAVLRIARDAVRPPVPCGRWTDVEVADRSVRLPRGVGVDLGGIAKGWTVDLAVDRARSAGARWIVVSAGGDLRIGGRAPVVPIGIDDPDSPGCSIATLRPDRGALATSSTVRRSWGPGLHHLIDPRTGAPAVTDAVQATVWAPTCTEAEVAAKVALLTGTPAAADVPAAIIGVDGRVHVSFRSDPTSTDDGREAA